MAFTPENLSISGKSHRHVTVGYFGAKLNLVLQKILSAFSFPFLFCQLKENCLSPVAGRDAFVMDYVIYITIVIPLIRTAIQLALYAVAGTTHFSGEFISHTSG